MSSSYLPWEMVTQILTLLPVKSLLRFRCVSNPCNSLITSPNFIIKHLNHSTREGNKYFILGAHFSDGDAAVPAISYDDDSPEQNFDLGLLFNGQSESEYVETVGCCNGLVCLTEVGDGSFNFLWNPATRDIRSLPRSPLGNPDNSGSVLAFGFDSDNQDYKLLRLAVQLIPSTSPVLIELYAMSTNSWRVIHPDFAFIPDVTCSSTLLHGSFHWCDVSDEMDGFIVSFDIGNEVFQKLPSVDFRELQGGDEWMLDVMNGSLVMVSYPVEQEIAMKCFQVWLMHDYGVNGYWTRLLCIGPFSRLAWPIGIWKDCELLLQFPETKESFSFNLVEKEMSSPSLNLEDWCGVYGYMESLVLTDGA